MVSVLPVEKTCAESSGEIRAVLVAKGEIIGGNDLCIAAHAKSLGLTLIKNNQRDFKRVPACVEYSAGIENRELAG